ncbi:MAG: phosphodiester glycosidase family protein [Sporichthyaceae bacterium]
MQLPALGLLVVAGSVALPAAPALAAPADGNQYRRHVRTIAATTADGRIVMATIGSRVTPQEAAGIAAGLGMTDAINLDGGGSSAMAVRGRLVNRSGAERAGADALVWQVAGSGGAGKGVGARKPPKVKAAPVSSQWWVWNG